MMTTKEICNPAIEFRFFAALVFLLLIIWSPQNASATNIKVSFDRNPVSLDESFQLIFTANESPDDDPDFTPLEQNFTILNQNNTSSASWINGKSSKTVQWILTVKSKSIRVCPRFRAYIQLAVS